MISVITSVYKKEVYEKFKKNIGETIGVAYELIGIDNGEGKMGLCEVYNSGARNARFDILCFAHEDILITTMNWGEKVIESFQQHPNVGLIGVAGTLYKSYAPTGWGAGWELSRANFIQHHKSESNPSIKRYENPHQETLSKVVCVDGMWMCTPKKIALELQFDEHTFKGFHCYDLDYSLRVFQTYDVAVTFTVMIEHFSEGTTDKSWVGETIKLHKKWEKHLPVNLSPMPVDRQAIVEKFALENFIETMKSFGFGFLPVMKVVTHNFRNPALQKNAYAHKLQIRLIKEFIKFRVLRFPQPQNKTA